MSTNIKDIIAKSGYSVATISKGTNIPAQRIYGWLHREGARPKKEDIEKIKEFLHGIKPAYQQAYMAVLTNKVAQILSRLNNTTALVELELIKKEVRQLEDMYSS